MKMLSSKGGIVLPSDVVNDMFMKYCDHETLCSTRDLQSTRVRRCTQFGDMEEASKAGNLENVKWIFLQNDESNPKKNGDCLTWASKGGHLDCFKWLFHAFGLSFMMADAGCLYCVAAEGEKLEICTWLMEYGVPLNQSDFNCVVIKGNVEVIEWCLQNGAVLDEQTFWCGVQSKKIEVLEWLKLNECPWGNLSLEWALRLGVNDDLLNWMKKNGCP